MATTIPPELLDTASPAFSTLLGDFIEPRISLGVVAEASRISLYTLSLWAEHPTTVEALQRLRATQRSRVHLAAALASTDALARLINLLASDAPPETIRKAAGAILALAKADQPDPPGATPAPSRRPANRPPGIAPRARRRRSRSILRPSPILPVTKASPPSAPPPCAAGTRARQAIGTPPPRPATSRTIASQCSPHAATAPARAGPTPAPRPPRAPATRPRPPPHPAGA